jgi:hypothetical protein
MMDALRFGVATDVTTRRVVPPIIRSGLTSINCAKRVVIHEFVADMHRFALR